MPVGRFRKNPRELDEVEKRVAAAQYPEGSLLFGMGVGLVIPLAIQGSIPGLPSLVGIPSIVGTLGTGLGPMVGGVAGYLLGHAYKQRRIGRLRGRSERETADGVRPSPKED